MVYSNRLTVLLISTSYVYSPDGDFCTTKSCVRYNFPSYLEHIKKFGGGGGKHENLPVWKYAQWGHVFRCQSTEHKAYFVTKYMQLGWAGLQWQIML